MLRTLNIENIAVIEKAQIEFNKGLNVLTGETGAGKSIVVDSINAILGERTSRELVRHGADHAFVSAYFDDISYVVKDKLKELGFEAEEDGSLLLTRRISESGKSVCKINGASATVSILKEIGQLLVNIHGQHDSQQLLNPDSHYLFIDMLGDDKGILADYKKSFHELISVRRRLKALTADEEDKERTLELLNYQIKELEAANITVGEREELGKKKLLIENGEAMLTALSGALAALNGDDDFNGAQTLISSSVKELNSLKAASETIKQIASKLTDIGEIIEEVKDLIDAEILSLDFDEGEREQVEDRLDLLYKLSGKYGETEADMLAFLEKAREKRNSILNNDEELERLTAQYDKLFDSVVENAEKLSEYRKKTAKKFESDVKAQLEFLDMPKIQFIVKFDRGNLSSNGFDKIEFLISTNPGEPAKPLAKIASGGELSRIMLAIKNVIVHNDTIGTLIFDEIDTGVSGRASRKIGLKLKAVSKETQVITVTHSAQIASAADEHFLISKDFDNNKTYTKVSPLDFEGRKRELARIMGGLQITDTLLKSAEEMLSSQEDIQ
ncbi:MAG: DNA repair protein RecN [Eubacterium sp.]|nr:DNA repair protein RecN [Eubacterium sp.]